MHGNRGFIEDSMQPVKDKKLSLVAIIKLLLFWFRGFRYFIFAFFFSETELSDSMFRVRYSPAV